MGCQAAGSFSIPSPTLQKTWLWFCGPNVIHCYFCDSAPLLMLSCSDTRLHFLSLLFVLVSYILIVLAVLHLPLSSRHLPEVEGLLYPHLPPCPGGPALWQGHLYLCKARQGPLHTPQQGEGPDDCRGVTPFLNPFIFTF